MVTIHDGEQSAANGIWCARFAHSSVFTYGDAHARPALTNQPYIDSWQEFCFPMCAFATV